MRVGKLVKLSSSSLGYQIFVAVAKLIPDNPSREIVKQAFNILAGSEPFTKLAENLLPPLCNCTVVYRTRISYRMRMVHTVRVYSYGMTIRVWYSFLYHMSITTIYYYSSQIIKVYS